MAATSTSTDSNNEGPLLSVVSKRLRALRKKLNRILQMEDSLSQGKTLNQEQQEVLRSKSSVLALIDELEKLRAPLSTALHEEISIALNSSQQQQHQHQQQQTQEEQLSTNNNHLVKDLLHLMYFGSLFDVKPQGEFTSLMLTRTHERSCCLTYDYVTDDATDLLVERDLDLISALQALIVSRPVNSALSHQNALETCLNHANLWLSNSDELIDSHSNVTCNFIAFYSFFFSFVKLYLSSFI